ncbi:hypothetical protein [Shimia sp. SDUM112013]|uniref:hypothetical protein n=1 Tax=Shimia sp. SDUM112013 TaxID=3136160 RepID=UPI0032ED0A17
MYNLCIITPWIFDSPEDAWPETTKQAKHGYFGAGSRAKPVQVGPNWSVQACAFLRVEQFRLDLGQRKLSFCTAPGLSLKHGDGYQTGSDKNEWQDAPHLFPFTSTLVAILLRTMGDIA